jgi:hypothetical protein
VGRDSNIFPTKTTMSRDEDLEMNITKRGGWIFGHLYSG